MLCAEYSVLFHSANVTRAVATPFTAYRVSALLGLNVFSVSNTNNGYLIRRRGEIVLVI